MLQIIRDFVAINHIERKLNRKLTDEEKCGLKPIEMWTEDGVRAKVYVELLPFRFLFPDGAR